MDFCQLPSQQYAHPLLSSNPQFPFWNPKVLGRLILSWIQGWNIWPRLSLGVFHPVGYSAWLGVGSWQNQSNQNFSWKCWWENCVGFLLLDVRKQAIPGTLQKRQCTNSKKLVLRVRLGVSPTFGHFVYKFPSLLNQLSLVFYYLWQNSCFLVEFAYHSKTYTIRGYHLF